jgi:hypothetical protein
MFSVKFDAFDIETQARALGTARDQIPFTLALALNDAAKTTKQHLVAETWPQHVTQRNTAFIKRALQIDYATKRELRVEIYDDLHRANLLLHLLGGTATPHQGRFAIPSSTAVAKTAHGVRSSQKPRAIANSFVANLRGRGDAVWKRTGRKGRNLKLMYVLKPSSKVPADVPFERDFQDSMITEVRKSMPRAMARAMKGREAWRY